MPLLSTAGAASHRGFSAYGSTSGNFIVATGGTIYVDPTDANYKIHQFTSYGTFVVTECPPNATAQALLVAGGGGGYYGGGGGGGYIFTNVAISTGSFYVDIGAGGSAGAGTGGNTTFAGLVALGGGGAGQAGGSGGGGYADVSPGAGLQPTSSSGGEGYAGDSPQTTAFVGTTGGGGGGAGGGGGLSSGGSGSFSPDIVNSSGTYDVFAAGGYGNDTRNVSGQTTATSVALPAVVANSGNGGWGGGNTDVNNNYVDFGSGQAGIVRIRYKFQ